MYRIIIIGWMAMAAAAAVPTAARGQGGVGEVNLPYKSLVSQLGAKSYTKREQARQELLEIGIAAKPALAWGMKHDDLEIRLGAHRIMIQIMQYDFDARIEAFLNDSGTDGTHDLPGWPLFRKQVGDTQTTRRLYADMLRAENDLITAVGRNDTSLEQLLIDRIQYLTSSRAIINGQRPTLTGATLATILFAGIEARKSPSTGPMTQTVSLSTSRIYSILNYTATRQAILQGAYSSQIKQLLSGWIDRLSDSQEQYGWSYAMQLALKFDLREQGPKVARKVLKNPGTTSSSIPYAAIVLGRFGTAEDIKELEPHLYDTQVFHTWSNRQLKKEPIRIQVRDAVLAMIIRLNGEDPAAYGFKLLQADETTIYKVYTLGFLEDSERDAALTKWKTRNDKDEEQEKDEVKPKEKKDEDAAASKPADVSDDS